jgi:hypothetical protein
MQVELLQPSEIISGKRDIPTTKRMKYGHAAMAYATNRTVFPVFFTVSLPFKKRESPRQILLNTGYRFCKKKAIVSRLTYTLALIQLFCGTIS